MIEQLAVPGFRMTCWSEALVREDPAWRESSADHSFAPCKRNTLPDDRIEE